MSVQGQWLARYGGPDILTPLTTAHLVESEVAERVLTRCGRMMAFVTPSGGELHLADGHLARCKQCTGATAP